MIRRKGSRYEHSFHGLRLGTHKKQADAKLMDDAVRLGVTPEKVQKARKK